MIHFPLETQILEMLLSLFAVMHQVGWSILVILLATKVFAGFFDERNVFITSFKYKSCDPNASSKNEIWIKEADILTTIYGDLDILGTVVTNANLTAPIKASVSLRRNILGLYIPIPCIKKFGSCHYPDLCVYGYPDDEECPPIFDEHDVPCRCPIEQGVYTFPGGHFSIPKTRWAGLLAGKYKGMVKLYTRNRMVFCYKFYFSLD